MKVVKLIVAIGCLVAFCNFKMDANTLEWTLRKDKEGIQIFTREAPNTSIKEIKTVLTINTSIDQIIKAIIDVENYSNWMDNVIHPKILKKINEEEYFLYYEIEAPWPTENRDIINHTTISHNQKNNTVLISATAMPNYIKKNSNMVRIELSQGSWSLETLSENRVEVTHVLLASPGGSIPEWVINMFIVNHPFDSHRKLREMLEDD